MVAFNVGDQIINRYLLLREEPERMGSEVFGRVWAALDVETDDVVRLVHVDAELLPNADARAAFIAGVRKAKAATLEALVPILDVTTSGDDCFVVYGAPQSAFPLEEIFAEMSSEDRRAVIPRFAVLLAK